MKIGFIQTRGIGDIIIALPIARHLVDQGHTVVASYVHGAPQLVARPELARIMKFDQYKYAVAGVPFREKWNLRIDRNHEREEALFARVVREKEFVVCHLQGSHFRADLDVRSMAPDRQVVEISDLTDNFFDWLTVIERASPRIMIEADRTIRAYEV